MVVFVKNKHGRNLMPCSERKARILLKSKKSKIISYKPFGIQLLCGSSGYTQNVTLGVDLGAKNLGIAVTSQCKVLLKGEVELRQDVKGNLKIRKDYRRSRRKRKTRYRKARFSNRIKTKKEGWLPPSLQSRINNSFNWIDKFISFLPNPTLKIEVGKFDVQKMMNPLIEGIDYQKGEKKGYHNVRYFVFARDRYTCQVCKKKEDNILNTHHIVYKSHGGSDRADNLITVGMKCHTHENHQEGNIFWQWMKKGKKLPSYQEIPYMNSLRLRTFQKYPKAQFTYGSITTPKRIALGLKKSHYNDAIAITDPIKIKDNPKTMFKIIQFRKKKRSLHEGTARKGKKQKNITAKRNKKNTKRIGKWHLNDEVCFKGKKGWITGFSGKTCYVKDIEGKYLSDIGKSYKQINLTHLTLIRRNNNWQYSIVTAYAD